MTKSTFYTSVYMRGNKVYYRGYHLGMPVQEVVDYKPYVFMPSPTGEYRTIDKKPLKKVEFDDVRSAKDFVKSMSDVSNGAPFGLDNFLYLYIYDRFPTDIHHDPELINKATLDIECAADQGFPDIQKADKEITAITLRSRGKSFVFGCGDFVAEDPSVFYFKCDTERELLFNFIKCWNSLKIEIVTGWNIEFFDIPYMINRIKRVLNPDAAKKLSPWNMIDEREIESRGKTISSYNIPGVAILDYYQLYRKFKFGNQESYKLDYIAQVELKEKKVDYSEYGSLLELYRNNFQKFIEYNIHDCVLVDRLDEKLGFLSQVIAFAHSARVNYADTMTTIRPSDMIIHAFLMRDKRVIPPGNRGNNVLDQLMGGYVKDPRLGVSKWVVSLDLDSLYPHLIMQYNISPETFFARMSDFPSIDSLLAGELNGLYGTGLDRVNFSYSANGCAYRKDEYGFLPQIMQELYDDRVKYKKLMIEAKKKFAKTKDPEDGKNIARYHNLQLSKKISLNSFYGALANPYFRWFNFNHAEAITSSGQLTIRWTEMKLNAYMNKMLKTKSVDYVIASDTDSIYIDFEPIVKIFGDGKTDLEITTIIDKIVVEKIEPELERLYNELVEYMGAYQQKMHMKRETIASKAIWKAKKMYVLNALNIEGVQYDPPELKMSGIEAVRSSTPHVCRDNIKKALSIVMNGTEDQFQGFVRDFRDEFDKLPFEAVASPRSVNGMEKYADRETIYKKSTPIAVRGALLFNQLLDKHSLGNIPRISDGDKVKFAYLKMPNPIFENVISAPDEIPDVFDLEEYVDKEMQFSKTFVEPLKSITDVIGWNVEPKATLASFFS